MTVEFDATEVAKLAQALSTSDGRVTKVIVEAVRESGKEIEATARQLAPRRTGALARSIHSATSAKAASATAEIGAFVRYAPYVEHGTARASAQPFLGPALDAGADPAAERIVTAAAEAVLP